ncbi:Prefoldin subunit 4 [Lemmus lemmus]
MTPYQIGDVFISHSQEETQEMLEEAKKTLQETDTLDPDDAHPAGITQLESVVICKIWQQHKPSGR